MIENMAIYPLGVIGPWEIVIIFLVVLLLFGGKKIPELMKGLGKGVKSFKEGVNEAEAELRETKAQIDRPVSSAAGESKKPEAAPDSKPQDQAK
jgi:sec-independent protein translocase protein TatA